MAHKINVQDIAQLARIDLEEALARKLQTQLGDILAYVEELSELDTDQVEPTMHAVNVGNVFRADQIQESLALEDVLKNAPSKDDRFFTVPKVIE